MATSTRQIMEGKCLVSLLIRGMNMKNTLRPRDQDPTMEVPGPGHRIRKTAMAPDHLVSQQIECLRELLNFLKSSLLPEINSAATLQVVI